MDVIALANQKGGVAKTTSAATFGAILAAEGFLYCDMFRKNGFLFIGFSVSVRPSRRGEN